MIQSRNVARRRQGFTLLELLVVIAIIAIIVGLVLSSGKKTKEDPAKTQPQREGAEAEARRRHEAAEEAAWSPALREERDRLEEWRGRAGALRTRRNQWNDYVSRYGGSGSESVTRAQKMMTSADTLLTSLDKGIDELQKALEAEKNRIPTGDVRKKLWQQLKDAEVEYNSLMKPDLGRK